MLNNYNLILGLLCLIMPKLINGQCDRKVVIEEYNERFLTTNVTWQELEWTGDPDICDAGTISQFAINATLDRINYFRMLVGLSTVVHFDSSLNVKAQQAALIMDANNDLDHFPPIDWSCYSEEGSLAASKSNLALGAHSSNAISLYIRDPGVNNGPVGHRRWILFSRASQFGLGSTNTAQALWVIGKRQPDPGVDFIAYPPSGFCPKPLIYPRWSFSKPKADFSQAEIFMYDKNSVPISLNILEEKKGFGDNTIVWEPEYSRTDLLDDIDHLYSVEINNVIHDGVMINYTYDVIFTNPNIHPPKCSSNFTWNENSCACESLSSPIESIDLDRAQLFPNPFKDQISITGIPKNSILDCFNINGTVMAHFIRPDSNTKINTSNWANGIYIFKLQVNDQVKNYKMIKQ